MKDRPRENSLEEGLHSDHIKYILKNVIEIAVYEILLSLLSRYKVQVQYYSQVPDKCVDQMNVLAGKNHVGFFCTVMCVVPNKLHC